MELLHTKLRHLKAVSPVDSFFSLTPIKYIKVNPGDANRKREIYTLANNPTTSSSLLDCISMTHMVTVLESVAGNGNASKATLQRLANHYSPLVRAAVIENRHTPFEVLSQLSEDTHPDVRFAMAENSHVPKSLLAKLATDDNPYVASRACTTLERLDSNVYYHQWL